MKLYTEEQINKILFYISPKNENYNKIKEVIEVLKPIELPSDEHIYNILRGKKMFEKDWGFIEGAKWMKDKIINQNK